MVNKKAPTFNEDPVRATIEPLKEFMQDSVRLIKRCNKPDAKGELFQCGEFPHE